MGIATGGQANMAEQQSLAAQETAADIKVKEAQAQNIQADTAKKQGAETDNLEAATANLQQLTQNEL